MKKIKKISTLLLMCILNAQAVTITGTVNDKIENPVENKLNPLFDEKNNTESPRLSNLIELSNNPYFKTLSNNRMAMEWEWQNPIPTGNCLFDSWIFDEHRIIGVGGAGTIIKTDDGGETWSYPAMNGFQAINSIFFVNDYEGWLCRSNGEIFQTSDGGETWELNHTVESFLTDIFFINEDVGWIVGSFGAIFKTIDGGQNWITLNSGVGHYFSSLYFIDENIGWVAGQSNIGEIIKTIDGGQTWDVLETNVQTLFECIYFVNEDIGFAGGIYTDSLSITPGLIRTEDGGNSWEIVDEFMYEPIRSINFHDEQTGWVSSEFNTYKTIDEGISWSLQSSFGGWALHFSDNQYGVNMFTSGIINYTNDGGNNWVNINQSVTPVNNTLLRLRSLSFIDANIGMVCGHTLAPFEGVVFKTIDGGENWDQWYSYEYDSYSDIHLFDDNSAIIIGSAHSGRANGVIRKYSSSSQSWDSLYTENVLRDMFFINDNVGFIVGWEGQFYNTTDSGASWDQFNSNLDQDLYSVWFHNENFGLSSGDNGIFKTNNGGQSWQQVLNAVIIYDIFFIDNLNGWAVGGGGGPSSSGTIFRTTDGGNTWETIADSGIPYWLTNVYFIDELNGWITGMEKMTFKTTDGGNTWYYYPFSSTDIDEMFFVSADTGWAVGSFGMIVKTTNGGQELSVDWQDTNDNTLNHFKLVNNFPNPFNSQTIIRFTVGLPQKTTIQIFDLNGRLIETLINERIKQGVHEIVWNANKHPSGVYFVRLQSGELFETQKVVLMK